MLAVHLGFVGGASQADQFPFKLANSIDEKKHTTAHRSITYTSYMAPPPVVDFSDLPTEALDEIARRAGPVDNVLCSAVCRSWRRALRSTRLRHLGRRPDRPRHVHLRPRYYGDRGTAFVKISPYCSSDTAVAVETSVDDEVVGRRVIGCSTYGWLVTVDDISIF